MRIEVNEPVSGMRNRVDELAQLKAEVSAGPGKQASAVAVPVLG